MWTLWQRALLSSLTTPQEGAEAKLERLCVQPIAPSHLCYIPLLRRLHTQQFTVPTGADKVEVIDLLRALTASRLLPRHLSMQRSVVGRLETWSREMFYVIPTFIVAHGRQLLTLELIHEDRVDDPPHLGIVRAVTHAVLSCHSLRRLRITEWWLSPSAPASPTSAPALPGHQSLRLDVVTRIDKATVAVLLDSCPHLQKLTLHIPPFVWVGERCHELRTLVMTPRGEDDVKHKDPLTLSRWAMPPLGPTLP